jgi:N-acetylmuramoyl-L-alanine amidase
MPPLAPEIRQIQEVKNNSESKNKLVCNLTPYADSGSNFSGTNLEIKASDTIHYKAFYLDNPKRYVLDIENCPELPQFNSSVPQTNRYINDIRWGKPYDDQPILRVVFDLTENKSQITDLLSNDKLSLNITFSSPPSPEPINLAAKTSPTPTFPENIGLRAKIPRGKYLIIDPGHGGSDPGAQRKEINEKDLTLGICLKLEKLLERNGLKVLLTRKDDSYISLQERVDITNSSQADAFLSVHINSLETNQAITGIETYYQTQGSKTMAQFIHSELVSGLEANDRRVRQARFYVINHTPLPAVLAEVGFISNQTERDKLASDNYQNLVAKCLYRGIIYYLAGKENGN